MLFPKRFLEGIARGEVTRAYRRWERPRVRVGGRLRTAAGVLVVEAVDPVDVTDLTDAQARLAGYGTAAELVRDLDRYGTGQVYRIALRHDGADPRIALRERAVLAGEELAELRARLARLDRASPRGPWTDRVLRLIDARPGVRAPDLAAAEGRDTLPFKVDVRKLKELGLTESLRIGYRISPRGRALLTALDADPGSAS